MKMILSDGIGFRPPLIGSIRMAVGEFSTSCSHLRCMAACHYRVVYGSIGNAKEAFLSVRAQLRGRVGSEAREEPQGEERSVKDGKGN